MHAIWEAMWEGAPFSFGVLAIAFVIPLYAAWRLLAVRLLVRAIVARSRQALRARAFVIADQAAVGRPHLRLGARRARIPATTYRAPG